MTLQLHMFSNFGKAAQMKACLAEALLVAIIATFNHSRESKHRLQSSKYGDKASFIQHLTSFIFTLFPHVNLLMSELFESITTMNHR